MSSSASAAMVSAGGDCGSTIAGGAATSDHSSRQPPSGSTILSRAMSGPNEALNLSNPVQHSNYVPEKMERHFQVLQFSKESHHLLLGCTSLTTELWTGSLWYYEDPAKAPAVRDCLTGLDLESGLCDADFVSDDGKRMVAALDDGSLEFYSLSFSEAEPPDEPAFHFLERTSSVREHDDLVTALSVTPSSVVTASYDRSLVALDLKTLGLVRRFERAHRDVVLDVHCRPGRPEVVASASQDGRVALWDTREERCKNNVYNDASSPPSCLRWCPNSENLLLAGDYSGRVSVLDLRKGAGAAPVSSTKVSEQRIGKIRFSPHKPDLFAVCGDARALRVFSFDDDSSIRLRHEDASHTDFVRGLCWHPTSEVVWTCGWDRRVISRDVASSSSGADAAEQ